MADLFAEITQAIHTAHPGAIYVEILKMSHRVALFGIVLHFRRSDGASVYGWRDHESATVALSDQLPPM